MQKSILFSTLESAVIAAGREIACLRGELLKPDIILDQFPSANAYHDFLKTSTAKLKPGEYLTEDLLLD